MEENIVYKGVNLFVGWSIENSLAAEELPSSLGIYAEICWPQLGVRIGETGLSVRRKIMHDIRWFKKMHDGTERPEQLRRTSPICLAAKSLGHEGFKFYLVSSDPALADKQLRQQCERYLFRWCEAHPKLTSWNFQHSWQ